MPSTEQIAQLKNEIRAALAQGATPIAAFDADGTLWDTDMGENFFQYQIDHNCIELPENPWDHYHKLKDASHPEAYLWLAQILEGNSISQVRVWAKQALNVYKTGVPIFSWKKDLISFLHQCGVKVYVVTASITWAVEPAAQLLGIAQDCVVGVETELRDGMVTARQNGPITWRQGKVEGLLLKTNGKRPFLAAGNTMGDFHLIESATHVQIVNATVDQSHENFSTEQELIKIGRERGWHILSQERG